MRDVWVTVGSFKGDVKGWPFGMLLEGSKSSLGRQPQGLFSFILCYKHRIDVFELTRNLTDKPILFDSRATDD